MKQIINSLLENDLYKFSMGQVIYHQFSDYKTTWTFKCRNKDVHFTPEMVEEIKSQVKRYCNLKFTEDELAYLHNIKWLKGSYVDFLRLWQPRYEDFEITTDAECGLSIETFGTWLNTSMYEIPTLAIVNEVYFRMAYNYDELLESFKRRLDEKYKNLRSGHWYAGTFSEFGLRRRLSGEAQEIAVEKFAHLNDTMHSPTNFIGTSNVYLAKKYNLTPVGTMAHEWIMCVGQGNHKHNPAYSNWYALDAWIKESPPCSHSTMQRTSKMPGAAMAVTEKTGKPLDKKANTGRKMIASEMRNPLMMRLMSSCATKIISAADSSRSFSRWSVSSRICSIEVSSFFYPYTLLLF